MILRLRPHHLLCMLTYAGKGYSAAFTANFDRVTGRLSEGDPITVVSGPDDVCAPLLSTADPHCHGASVTERDHRAAAALSDLLDLPIAPGSVIRPDMPLLASLRQAFSNGRIRPACAGCEWHSLCTETADDGFAGTRLARAGQS